MNYVYQLVLSSWELKWTRTEWTMQDRLSLMKFCQCSVMRDLMGQLIFNCQLRTYFWKLFLSLRLAVFATVRTEDLCGLVNMSVAWRVGNRSCYRSKKQPGFFNDSMKKDTPPWGLKSLNFSGDKLQDFCKLHRLKNDESSGFGKPPLLTDLPLSLLLRWLAYESYVQRIVFIKKISYDLLKYI